MTIRQFGLVLAWLWSGLSVAQPDVHYRAVIAMTQDGPDLKAPLAVAFEMEGVQDGACVYIPAHDQKLRKSLLLESIKAATPQENAGHSELSFEWIDKSDLEHIGPALYRINNPQGAKLALKYLLGLSGWADRDQAPKLLNLWHPIYLENCPSDSGQAFANIWPKVEFTVTLPRPQGWKLAAPGTLKGDTWTYVGSAFSAAFYKTGKQFTYQLGKQTLITVSRSDGFESLIGVAKAALIKFAKLTGVTAESTVLLVETDDLEPLRSPGLVTLNTPKQLGMRYLQKEFTHWIVWQLATHMAQQWFGLHCRAATVDDHWLMQSLADILVYSLVLSEAQYFEFFSRDKNRQPYLHLNYRQAQDLAAASMSLMYPQSSLLDENGRSRPASLDKPFFAFIRGTQILRYLQWKLGNRGFQQFLQSAVTACSEQGIAPKELAALANAHGPGLGALMMQYWASDDWPDVSLQGTEVRDGKVYLKLHYENDLLMPIDVWVTTKDGAKRVFFTEPLQRELEIPLDEQEGEIGKIEINPGRALFDKDRFNNKTGTPRLVFFPGAARGLDDDAYTVVWVPYASQLPGEPFTINLTYQTLRYLSSGLRGTILHQPSKGRTGFSLNYRIAIPESSLSLLGRVAQDDGYVDEGERRISLDIRRRPILDWMPRFSLGLRIKSKQILGQPETRHGTVGGNLAYASESGQACSSDQEMESESTVSVPSHDFQYLRSFARVSASCESKALAGRVRLFYGSSRAEGKVPRTALFRAQNLEEAHVRLDTPTLEGSLRIASFNAELAVPAKLPLPESWFVLPRRSQFKMFIDGAETRDPNRKVLVSGLGYSLPVGGDIAGKDSLTLMKFSLNGVFYRDIDGKVDRSPGILFDFSGNL